MTRVPNWTAWRDCLSKWPVDFALVLVITTALLVRLGFALRPPPFLTPDSQGYFLPGWELAHGLPFAPELRRTPGYPLFIAGTILLLGDDLRALVLAQHGLGVVTAGLSYALGRVAFGKLAGLLAGLAVAFSGPLLVYEHHVLTESLGTCLLTLSMLLALQALRQPTAKSLVIAGLALAATILTRPVAQVLLPVLPLALLARSRIVTEAPLTEGERRADGWRAAIRRSAWFGLGVALLVLPWMARNALSHGTFRAEGALGQALIGRTARHDDYKKFYACSSENSAISPKDGALKIICDEAAGEDPSGGRVTQRVRDELGLTEAETSSLLRQVGLEAIAGRPEYYVFGSLKMAGEILTGKRESIIAPWRQRTTRNWENKWDPRLTPLVKQVPPVGGPEYERADALVSFFQPFRWRRELGVMFGLGILAALARSSWRPALVLPLAGGSIILASAALDGNVWRYRYPVDPLLAVMVGGGAQAFWLACTWAVRRTSVLKTKRQALAEEVERSQAVQRAAGRAAGQSAAR